MIEVAVVALLSAANLRVSVEQCGPAPSAEEIHRIAALELTRAPSDVELSAMVECRGSLSVVSVDDPLTRKTLVRRVDLTGVPPAARARTVALALVELVEASWSELLLTDERVPPTKDLPTIAAREVVAEVARKTTMPFRAEVIGGGRRFPSMALWLWGGGARLGWRPGLLGVGVDLRAEHAEVTNALGLLTVDTIGGSLYGVVGLSHPWLVLEGGIGVRMGSARVTGAPRDSALATGASVAGVWLGPMAFGQFGVQWDRLVVLVGIEGGSVLVGVRGRVDGTGGVGVSGPNFQLSASWGLRL